MGTIVIVIEAHLTGRGELSEFMVERMVPEAAAAPMLLKLKAGTGGTMVELTNCSTPVAPGKKDPRIRVTSALISSVIRLIRSRMLLKNAAPGILELDTEVVAAI